MTILVYGDSNSHGTLPLPKLDSFGRLARGQRWPDVMAAQLPGIEVINEGLPGRTTVHEDVIDGGCRNGVAILPAILLSHAPIDLFIIMLGTNDLKARFSVGAFEIARSVRRIVLEAKASETVQDAMIVAPVPVREIGTLADTYLGGEARQQGLAQHLQDVADALGAGFFDAGGVASVSDIDGVHFGAEAHRAIGEAMAEQVAARLGIAQT